MLRSTIAVHYNFVEMNCTSINILVGIHKIKKNISKFKHGKQNIAQTLSHGNEIQLRLEKNLYYTDLQNRST